MNKAKISEIFMSYQGEGPHVGAKQVFIRFYGCSLECVYCDTKSYSAETFTAEALLNRVNEYGKDFHSLSLTGGEPLEQADFLGEFFALVKKTSPHKIYLETNGIRFREMERLADFVDFVAMDIKLPSVTGKRPFWDEHRAFLEKASRKDIFVKAVITGSTTRADIMKAKDIVKSVRRDVPFVLQPVDPVGSVKAPSKELLLSFKRILEGDLKDVRIMTQWHKEAGIR